VDDDICEENNVTDQKQAPNLSAIKDRQQTNGRTLTVTWQDPMVGARAAKEMSGLEFWRAILKGEVPQPPICDLVGFEVVEVEEGRVVFEWVPGEQHFNPTGVVQGGLACTLLDAATGVALHTMLPAGTGYTTLELKTNLLHPIAADTGTLRCEGHTIHVGGRVALAEASLTDESGILYAHATSTLMVFRPRKEAPKGAVEGEPGATSTP
jgi:uncharacterized protein (TIGR00369 family)